MNPPTIQPLDPGEARLTARATNPRHLALAHHSRDSASGATRPKPHPP